MRGFQNGVKNESSVGDPSPFNRYDLLIQLIYDPCAHYISFAF